VSRSTVGDVIVDGLKRAGTPALFAAVGGSHPLLDAARAADLSVTLASGETAACVMAAVSGDLVEAPGAVLIRSANRAVSAAVERAVVDRAPTIVLVDHHSGDGISGKAVLGVTPESAAHWIAHAARLSATHPRGPVLLKMPAEVARRQALPLATSCRPDPLPAPAVDALGVAARLLAGASRPLLLAGAHCRGGGVQHWVRALVETLPAPMLVTYRAKGALPDPHPLMLGVLGSESAGVDERLLKLADLVVGLGLDALEPVPEPWQSTAPVLAIGPPQTLADWAPTVEVTGDIAIVIEELAPRLRDRERADWDVAQLDRLRRERSAVGALTDAARATREVVRLAREATPAGTIATVDGTHLADVAAAWHVVAPSELLASGWSAAGFALPAALAARVVHPDRHIVCFIDADGLEAAAGELETAMRLGGPLIVVVFGSGASGTVDPIQLARDAHLEAFSVESAAQFAQALSRAMRSGEPTLIAG
jgi:acetolactate synthase I/II/III large subunit